MDRLKQEETCFNSGERGYMRNEYSKKEVKTNHLCLLEEDSSEDEYEPDTNTTEELDASSSIKTYKNPEGTAKNRPF